MRDFRSLPGRDRRLAIYHSIGCGTGLGERLFNLRSALRHPGVVGGYAHAFGRAPNLANPTLFTEKIAFRKAFDRNPQFLTFCDKLASRAYVSEIAPDLALPALIWSGDDPGRIPRDLAPPFVLKVNNASGRNHIVRRAADWSHSDAVEIAAGWLAAAPHARWSGEWAYAEVSPSLMVEALLPGPQGGEAPTDYKIYVFAGRAAFIYATAGRAGKDPEVGVFDRDWQPLPWDRIQKDQRDRLNGELPRPSSLARMLEAAEELAAGVDFLRVDFYEIEGKPYFGEFAVYPHSGHQAFGLTGDSGKQNKLDLELGNLWPQASRRRLRSAFKTMASRPF